MEIDRPLRTLSPSLSVGELGTFARSRYLLLVLTSDSAPFKHCPAYFALRAFGLFYYRLSSSVRDPSSSQQDRCPGRIDIRF